ncbi:hypothetical protein D3C72_2283530 [compost metagenome]
MVTGLALITHLFSGQLGTVFGVVNIANNLAGAGGFRAGRTQRLVTEQALDMVQGVQCAVALR